MLDKLKIVTVYWPPSLCTFLVVLQHHISHHLQMYIHCWPFWHKAPGIWCCSGASDASLNWKWFSWMWVTPFAEVGPAASLPPSIFLCEPDRDMWYSMWLRAGSESIDQAGYCCHAFKIAVVFSHWIINWHLPFKYTNWTPAIGLTRCLLKGNMKEMLRYSAGTMTINWDCFIIWFSQEGITGCEAALLGYWEDRILAFKCIWGCFKWNSIYLDGARVAGSTRFQSLFP